MTQPARCLTLRKGRERYVFRYPAGREADVLLALVHAAADPQSSLDWSDAASLGLGLTRAGRLSRPSIDLMRQSR